MAAHPKKFAKILPIGFSLFKERTEYLRLLSGRQCPGKTHHGVLPGTRYRALLLAVILVAGFLPAVSGAKDHQINAGAGYGGSIQPSGLVTVQPGDAPLFSITPAQGFRISSVIIDGSPVGAIPVYTFAPVHDDHMIFARFVRMTGSLYITSDPAGARVYLDDQYADIIPDQGGLHIGDVPVGPHTLRFILAGYQMVQIDVTVDEGEQTVIPPVILTPAELPATTAPTTAATIPPTTATTAPTTVPATIPTTAATTVPTTTTTTVATTVPTTVPITTPTTIPTTAQTTAATTVPTTTTTVTTTVPTTAPTTAVTTVPTTVPITTPTTIPTTAQTTAATTIPTTTTSVATTVPTTVPTTTATTAPTTTQATNQTPAPEPSPLPAGTGGVFVISDPTATIVIQGREWGRSNEVIEDVPQGIQTITLSRQGYVSQTLVVNIGVGSVTVTPKVTLELSGDAAEAHTPTVVPTPGTVSRSLENGALFIYTVPFGCSLSIDEISGGMTPKLITLVPPGTHAVTITLPGYRSSNRTIIVHPGDISVVLVMMTPDFGSIGSAFS